MRITKALRFRVIALAMFFVFGVQSIVPSSFAQSVLNLPLSGTIITTSAPFDPPIITGMIIHPENPLQFDFIVDTGDDRIPGKTLKKEANKLINYFMATLTVPEDEMWVNLSPYEKDRIIADGLGKTEMGRDMLVQDYLLKQLAASLMYPDGSVGKEFWDRVYKTAHEKLGRADIPTNLFNKVWIVPQNATVYVNGNNVFVTHSYLKVMLEQDYLALESNEGSDKHGLGAVTKDDINIIGDSSAQIIREVILPEIEKEVNEGKNFANLRQIYNSMILATWYKKKLKSSLLNNIYLDKNKTNGIELEDKNTKEKIYNQYLEAFKKGVYNYIKEDYDEHTQEVIARKYFSGGLERVEEVNEGVVPAGFVEKAERNPDVVVHARGDLLGGSAAILSDGSDAAMLGKESRGIEGDDVFDDESPFGISISVMKSTVRDFLAGRAQPDYDPVVLKFLNSSVNFSNKVTDPAKQFLFIGLLFEIVENKKFSPQRKDREITQLFRANVLGSKLPKNFRKSLEKMIADEKRNFAKKADIIGIFQTHMFAEDYQAIRPVLDEIAAVAIDQKRPVVYVYENAGTSFKSFLGHLNEHFGDQGELLDQILRDIYTINIDSEPLRHYYEQDVPPELREETKRDTTDEETSGYVKSRDEFVASHKNVHLVQERVSFRAFIMNYRIDMLEAILNKNVDQETFRQILRPGITLDVFLEEVLQADIFHLHDYLAERDETKHVEQRLGEITTMFNNPIIIMVVGKTHHKKLDTVSLVKYRTLTLVEAIESDERPEYMTPQGWLMMSRKYAPGLPLSDDDRELLRKLPEYESKVKDRERIERDKLKTAKALNALRAEIAEEVYGRELLDQLRGMVPIPKIEHIRIREGKRHEAMLASQSDLLNRFREVLVSEDNASISSDQLGGIDFNASNLNLKEQGQKVDINFSLGSLQNIQPSNVNGILPVIINITPVTNFPFLLGLSQEKKEEELSQL